MMYNLVCISLGNKFIDVLIIALSWLRGVCTFALLGGLEKRGEELDGPDSRGRCWVNQ